MVGADELRHRRDAPTGVVGVVQLDDIREVPLLLEYDTLGNLTEDRRGDARPSLHLRQPLSTGTCRRPNAGIERIRRFEDGREYVTWTDFDAADRVRSVRSHELRGRMTQRYVSPADVRADLERGGFPSGSRLDRKVPIAAGADLGAVVVVLGAAAAGVLYRFWGHVSGPKILVTDEGLRVDRRTGVSTIVPWRRVVSVRFWIGFVQVRYIEAGSTRTLRALAAHRPHTA